MLVLSLLLLTTLRAKHISGAQNYGVVVDAGSTGSRARIFLWHPRTKFEELKNKKVRPGLADVLSLTAHLEELVDFCKEEIPEKEWRYTPIFLLATGGVRMLPTSGVNDVMENARSFLRSSPFYFRDSHVRVLAGEEEGVYGWIAVNYLNGFLTKNVQASSGILEMGGASTQIAFLPDGPLLSNKYPVRLMGKSYSLYTHSYLAFGQNAIKNKTDQLIFDMRQTNETDFIHPCMLKGDISNSSIDGMAVTFSGGSDPQGCQKLLDMLLQKDPECRPKPCTIDCVYQPPLPAGRTFIAITAFLYTLNFLDIISPDGSVCPAAIREAAMTYCNKTFQEVMISTDVNPKYLSVYCIMGLYIPLLFETYGFDSQTSNIRALAKINGQIPDWTLGALILETDNLSLPGRTVRAPQSNASPRNTPCQRLYGILVSFTHIILTTVLMGNDIGHL